MLINHIRRKFRSQTSDNMDRWKAEMGRVREEKRREEKRREEKRREEKRGEEKRREEKRREEKRREEERISNKRKSWKKEDPGARKGRKVGTRCFSMSCGSGGSKSRLAKAADAEPSGQMRDEKLHAIVAQSTCPSQNVQSTPGLDRFWKLRCRKSAHRCGAKHISKSKVLKTDGLGPLLEVEMLKKCTTFWREAHFEAKSGKNDGLVAPLDVRMSFCVAGIRDSAPCQKWAKSEGLVSISTTTTTLHYTTLRYTTTTITTTTSQHYTTLHCITHQLQLQIQLQLRYIPLH